MASEASGLPVSAVVSTLWLDVGTPVEVLTTFTVIHVRGDLATSLQFMLFWSTFLL